MTGMTSQQQVQDMASRLIELLSRQDERYVDVLHDIIVHERDGGGTWRPDDYGLTPDDIEMLTDMGIVDGSDGDYLLARRWDIMDDALNEAKRDISLTEQSLGQPKMATLPAIDIEEYRQRFRALVETEDDLLDYWSRHINPKITGMERLKKAVLLSVASVNDRHGDRGRIHVLLAGEPGTSKSTVMLWVSHYLGAKFCSHRSSDVGLTGDASGNTITPGALPMSDGHVICVDELDKFRPKDFAGLLEAMSDGKVTINAGGKEAVFNARVRVICGCNSTDKFPDELMDRFDFKLYLEAPDRNNEKVIISSIIDNWFIEKPNYDGTELRAYLQWIKDYEPGVPSHIRSIIKKVIQMYIDMRKGEKGSIRRDEAIIRIAYTIAKLNHRDVHPMDAVRAIELMDNDINDGRLQGLRMLVEREQNR